MNKKELAETKQMQTILTLLHANGPLVGFVKKVTSQTPPTRECGLCQQSGSKTHDLIQILPALVQTLPNPGFKNCRVQKPGFPGFKQRRITRFENLVPRIQKPPSPIQKPAPLINKNLGELKPKTGIVHARTCHCKGSLKTKRRNEIQN